VDRLRGPERVAAVVRDAGAIAPGLSARAAPRAAVTETRRKAETQLTERAIHLDWA
jgi:hypothetical protein